MERLAKWELIAAREGAVLLHQIGDAIETIRSVALSCPAIKANIERIKFSEIEKLYEHHFPHWDRVRHAAVHFAEQTRTEKRRKLTAVSKPGHHSGFVMNYSSGELIVTGTLMNKKYIVTHKVDILSYELS